MPHLYYSFSCWWCLCIPFVVYTDCYVMILGTSYPIHWFHISCDYIHEHSRCLTKKILVVNFLQMPVSIHFTIEVVNMIFPCEAVINHNSQEFHTWSVVNLCFAHFNVEVMITWPEFQQYSFINIEGQLVSSIPIHL